MIKTIDYDETQVEFKNSVEKFIAQHVTPNYDQWESNGMVDRNVWNMMGELGMLCPNISEKYGGFGDFSYNILVNETLCDNHATSLAVGTAIHSDIVATYLDKYGSEDQKSEWLPKMVTGDALACLGMSEPNAGSDLGSITTKGVYDGDDIIISGQKVFITNGYLADFMLTAVRTEGEGYDGVSLVIIELDNDSVSRNLLNKIGLKSQDTAEIFLDDVRVPASNIVGKAGEGFYMMMDELPRERLSLCVGAVASSRAILRETVEYTSSRFAFGKPISALQNTQFEIADMDSSLCAAESFTRHCAYLDLEGKLDTAMASRLKVVTTDLQCDIVDRCLQLHGGYGYMSDYKVARAFCDGRVQKIYGGTNEIMKVIISKKIYGR